MISEWVGVIGYLEKLENLHKFEAPAKFYHRHIDNIEVYAISGIKF
jgi:hypothetical protein